MPHNAYTVQYGAGAALAGLRNLAADNNVEVQNDVAIGSPYPQFVAIVGQQPGLQFSADRIDTALAITGASGAPINASNNLVGYFARLGDDGLPAAGSVHRSYTVARGLLLPRRLSCGHRRPASLDLEAITYSTDGLTHPFTIADNVALPTLPAADVQHTLGKIVLGSSVGDQFTFGCATDLAIDFGNRAQTRGCGSDIFDRHVEQPGIQQTITITGLDAENFGPAGVPPIGKKLTHGFSEIYLRKRDDGIGFVADNVAEHVKLTVDGVAVVTQHTGNGQDTSQVTVQITCKRASDGTIPITVNSASQIT